MAKLQVAENIRRFAEHYKIFVEAAEQLDSIGSLEQAAKEAKAQADASMKELADIKADTAKAKAALKKVTESVEGQTAEEMAEAEQKVKDAEAKATKLIDDANIQAMQLIADANTKADTIKKEGAVAISKVSEELRLAKIVLVELQGMRDKVKSEADAITKQSETLKTKLKNLIG